MNTIRNFVAVVTGYALFVISAVLLFELSGVDPHADPSLNIIVITIGYGLIFAYIGGFLTQFISRSGSLIINYVLAGIMAGFASFSLFKTTGNHYTQFAAIFLFAPASVLGGLTHLRRKK